MEIKYYKEFYPNGVLKESCPVNFMGELHGWCICYDEQGKEIEKVRYENGMYMGNPFANKTGVELVEALGGSIEEDFINEPGEEEILTPELASTLLKGEKYYGRK